MKTILHAEDRDDDRFFFRRACERSSVRNQFCLHSVCDGDEAVEYLSGQGIYTDRCAFPVPDLILVDLKMPHRDGLDLIRWIKRQPALGNIPVVILTSSNEKRDHSEAEAIGVAGYFVKAMGVPALNEMIGGLIAAHLGVPAAEPR